jgi:esterase/lipase superfamily enzyme
MYLITNRALNPEKKDLDVFAKTPNPAGPNELRLMRVTKRNKRWEAKVIIDKLTPTSVKALKKKYNLDLDISKPWHGSLKVACELFDQARKQKKSILFFIHGYNNDVEDVIETADEIEKLYQVIVVPFTWPANGGGAISGTASYLSDKGDARVSSGAFNRTVGKIQQLHLLLTAARKNQLLERAMKKHPDNRQAAQSHFVQLTEKDCPVTLNLLCHSMGNYVFKNTLKTADNATSRLVFDNICLVAADVNNASHAQWVGKLDARKRIYVVINENDYALRVARIKPGDEQLARLGHYTRQLNSPNVHYIDVTEARLVGTEHSYFKGDSVGNESLKYIFSEMFNGRAVENHLIYWPDNNSYKLDSSGIESINQDHA